jgi:Co/Zn/Cd efflux system component
MGLVGAVLVGRWALGLVRETSSALLDRDMDHPVVEDIRQAVRELSGHDTELSDLHVWRVGRARYACALTVVSSDPGLDAAQVRSLLAMHEEIVHATIEIHRRPARGSAGARP